MKGRQLDMMRGLLSFMRSGSPARGICAIISKDISEVLRAVEAEDPALRALAVSSERELETALSLTKEESPVVLIIGKAGVIYGNERLLKTADAVLNLDDHEEVRHVA